MRTKKILSIVLAAVMVIGVFAMFGVTANDGGYVGIEAQAAAATEWPSAVTIVNRLPRWNEATISWNVFTHATNGFAANRNTATVTWTVRGQRAGQTDWVTFTVHESAGAAAGNAGLQIFRNVTATTEELFIRQGRNAWFGTLEVTLNVTAVPTAGGAPVAGPASNTLVVTFVDRTEFIRTIERAEAMLENSNRYQDAFVADLRAAVNAANFSLDLDLSVPANAARIEADIAALQRLVDQHTDHYRLWFMTGSFGNFMGRIVWGIADFFAAVQVLFEPVVRIFTAFFGIFSFFLPIITILLALF